MQTQKLFKQDYVAVRLKSWLQSVYNGHHEVVDFYELSISQMALNLFPST
jgi:hypothetical protein